MMAGYWDDPGETRDVLRDGWLRTRDLGRLDGDGRLHLSGRARDVIMVNAMVVYAGPIERVLAGHPDVAEAYVAGAPDEETGEAVHAFVVPAHGRRPGGGALRDLVRDELGADSVPRTITVVPAVPTSAGESPTSAPCWTAASDQALRFAALTGIDRSITSSWRRVSCRTELWTTW